nr:hypothetical protein [Tanacetum cinerariifolium]
MYNINVRVGSILDDDNVIISSMSFGRIAPRKQAVMVIGVDEKPSKKALKKIAVIPAPHTLGLGFAHYGLGRFSYFSFRQDIFAPQLQQVTLPFFTDMKTKRKAIPRVDNTPTPYITSNIPSVEPDVLQTSGHATRMTDVVSRLCDGGDQVTGSIGSMLTRGKGKRKVDDRLDHSLEPPLTHNRQRTNESDNTSVANSEFQGHVNIKTNGLLFDAHTSEMQYQSSSKGHEQQGAPASCIGSDISKADLGGSCSSTHTMRLLNLSRAKGKRKWDDKLAYLHKSIHTS